MDSPPGEGDFQRSSRGSPDEEEGKDARRNLLDTTRHPGPRVTWACVWDEVV